MLPHSAGDVIPLPDIVAEPPAFVVEEDPALASERFGRQEFGPVVGVLRVDESLETCM